MDTGRNDPCPCNSGKKYKNCCLLRQAGTVPPAPAISLVTLLRQALASCEAQQWQQAELCCRQVLQLQPRQPDALHILGLVLLQTGRSEAAASCLGEALSASPSPNALLFLRHGVALQATGQTEKAVASYQAAVSAQPDLAEAHNNLGRAQRSLGKLDEAVASFRRATALQPGQALAHFNLGIALQEQQQLEPAAASFRAALALDARLPEAWLNLAQIARLDGQTGDAVDYCRQALALNPAMTIAHIQLGKLLLETGQLDSAISSFSEVLRQQPRDVDTWANLGQALLRAGRLPESEQCFRQILSFQPDHLPSYEHLNRVLLLAQQFREMEACCHQALLLKPDSAQALSDLGTALFWQGRLRESASYHRQALAIDDTSASRHGRLADTLAEQGLVDEAIASYERALALQPDHPEFRSAMLMCMQYSTRLNAEQVFAAHQAYDVHMKSLPRSAWPAHRNHRDPKRRLRVGYVSADFRNHSVAFFIEPVLTHHDRTHVEIFCYYNFMRTDAVTERIRALADHWLDCMGLSNEELEARIQNDEIDILVDLSGHTSGNRLAVFARKPAPVQVTWIGYPGTTGLEAMDYRLTDANLDPPGEAEPFHSEKLVRLGTSAAFMPAPESPPVNPLPAKTTGYVTLACLNKWTKISTATILLWARVLEALPSARLLLGNADDQEARDRILGLFAAAGVDLVRLELLPKMPLKDYLALHHRIDMALDPFPYAGGTTTSHALWMGVPVITLAGQSTASRQGAAVLNWVGQPECIARTPDEYVQKIVVLANDLSRLEAMRASLRERLAKGVSNADLTRNLEAAYRQMWQDWCAATSATPD